MHASRFTSCAMIFFLHVRVDVNCNPGLQTGSAGACMGNAHCAAVVCFYVIWCGAGKVSTALG